MIEALFGGEHGAQILMGTVGWDGVDEFYDVGDATNDGHALVRVQLFEGRDYTKPLNETVGQGVQIVCHLSGGMFRIPPKGTRVFVAVPKGMEHVVGAGVIFATIEKNPTTQFAEDRAVLDFGPNTHVVITGKSVTMQDPDYRFVSVGTPRSGGTAGVQVHLPDGTGAVWQDDTFGCYCQSGTVMQMTSSRFEVWQGTGSSGTFLKMGGGEFWTYGPANKMQGAGCYIGKLPTVAQTALYGTSASPVASTSVFLSA